MNNLYLAILEEQHNEMLKQKDMCTKIGAFICFWGIDKLTVYGEGNKLWELNLLLMTIH